MAICGFFGTYINFYPCQSVLEFSGNTLFRNKTRHPLVEIFSQRIFHPQNFSACAEHLKRHDQRAWNSWAPNFQTKCCDFQCTAPVRWFSVVFGMVGVYLQVKHQGSMELQQFFVINGPKRSNLDFTLQGGAPPSYKWVIIPITVDITPRNRSYSTYKPS